MEQLNPAKIFKALSNEQRLKIFMMIYNECCHSASIDASDAKGSKECCRKSGCMDRAFTKASSSVKISRSTVSHHIKELQNAGLIECERNGREFTCRVNEKAVGLVKGMFK